MPISQSQHMDESETRTNSASILADFCQNSEPKAKPVQSDEISEVFTVNNVCLKNEQGRWVPIGTDRNVILRLTKNLQHIFVR